MDFTEYGIVVTKITTFDDSRLNVILDIVGYNVINYC